MNDVLPFVRREHTMNVDTGDGFTCLACFHWLHESETEWGDYYVMRPKIYGHIHGRKPFGFCPNCGAQVVSAEEWAELYPQDQGKTYDEIQKRFYEDGGK